MDTCQNSMGAEDWTISMAVIIWGFWSILVRLLKFAPAGSHVIDKSNIFPKCVHLGKILFTIISYSFFLRCCNQWIHIHFKKINLKKDQKQSNYKHLQI